MAVSEIVARVERDYDALMREYRQAIEDTFVRFLARPIKEDPMDTVKHVIYEEKGESALVYEWRLKQYTGSTSGKPQGFLLEYRPHGTRAWTIFVDASLAEGTIEVQAKRLSQDGVKVDYQ